MEQVGGGTLPFFMALAEGFFNLPLPENSIFFYIVNEMAILIVVQKRSYTKMIHTI